jgi:hypothetical protein
MKKNLPNWRGLTVQLFATTVLPLTLLLLVIAFGSIYLHEQDMRALVSERDERAVQSAAAALESELHHRIATVASLAVFTDASTDLNFEAILDGSNDLTSDFDGGAAFLNSDGHLIANSDNDRFWGMVAQNMGSIQLVSSTDPEPVVASPFVDPGSKRSFVIISAYIPSLNVIAAGTFSPESLAAQTLSSSYPAGSQATIYLVDSSRRILFLSGAPETQSLSANRPGVTEALRGESGTRFIQVEDSEHVIAYSPISSTGWAIITEEAWQAVISPSLQVTQMAPLVLVPAFILALFALWFGAKQIVQPLQRLESKASALAWGDFDAIKESVGGISEVRHLQKELAEYHLKKKGKRPEGLSGSTRFFEETFGTVCCHPKVIEKIPG